ncbi:MauE/DoxX family redox-associated membrane protein [Lishizhenia sp.]|uniref:MauE/DoxX family redox-associated membrane protein n=1 Tax=Lishizhenia sp. TaxID=2497594 RepID=UPI00299E03E8|nr:MauE/DoxX family redox-associated membrane protein [Lishizhenia sp.]MDX1446570.1 hypothetical protein [Lishizhenia sp.]
MRTVDKIHGRSLPLNLIAILLNLTGLTFLVIGYHDNFEANAMLYKTIGSVLFFIGMAGFIALKGLQLSSYVFRAISGGLFIVSGLIKANDPLGFAYKLEEYFEDGALAFRVKELFNAPEFSLEFFIDYALPLSVIICILEIVLGVLLIIGGKLKLASFLTLGMMFFFTLLTWHTKECDPNAYFMDVDRYEVNSSTAQQKIQMAESDTMVRVLETTNSYVKIGEYKSTQCVSDCGCFGDALKGSVGRSLTPQESFWKDLIFLYFSIFIFIASFRSAPNTRNQNLLMIPASMIVSIFFSYVFGWYFPIFFALITILGALWVKRSNNKWVGNYWVASLWVIFISALFVTYVLAYMPVKDYRPYAAGSDLNEKMNDGREGVFETFLTYKNLQTGELKDFTSAEFSASDIWKPENKDKWEFVSSETKTIVPTKLPSIVSSEFNPNLNVADLTEVERNMPYVKEMLEAHQTAQVFVQERESGGGYYVPLKEYSPEAYDSTMYVIGDTVMGLDPYFPEVSVQELILTSPRMILLVSKNLPNVALSQKRIDRIKRVVADAQADGVPVVMAAVTTTEDIQKFREETGIIVPTFMNDEKILKAVGRANPTLMVIENGVVKAKYPYRSIQEWSWMKENALED